VATTLSALETQARRHLRELPALSDPSAPTVTAQGTTGATAYSYKVVAMHRHGQTAASAAGSVANGNATLSSTDFNRVTWTAVTGATAYRIYRTASAGTPSTTGQIGVVGAVTQFDDTGLAGDSSTAPTVNTTGGRFWSSDELIAHANHAIQDLWKAILDAHGDHFKTTDITNVTTTADGETLTGVPTDVFRILRIEPRDVSSTGSYRNVIFKPWSTDSDEAQEARSWGSVDPTIGVTVFFELEQAGAPIAAPTVRIAPKLTVAVPLRFVYAPVIATKTASDDNPIPGSTDNAVVAWMVAYARAKEREDRMPDPNWLAIYGTEKRNTLTAITPRQEQEPEVVQDMFDVWLS
jgi:hypothetical protein